jgi:hypothetical protein
MRNVFSPNVGKQNWDTEQEPYCRPERCKNCTLVWTYHFGWSCTISGDGLLKSQLHHSKRYLTPDMLVSTSGDPITLPQFPAVAPIPELPKQETHAMKEEKSEWKKWRDVNRRGNECPCGTNMQMCTYHRD